MAAESVVGAWSQVMREVVAGYLEHEQRLGLSPGDRSALAALDALRGARHDITELRSALGISAPAATAVVDRLERAGLARRVRDQHDRRRIHLELTEHALSIGSEWLTPWRVRVEEAVSGLDEAERGVISGFLARLANA